MIDDIDRRSPPVELRQVRAVVAVAETGHFGRAARSLAVTQSTLSHAVRSLEDELGVELFVRTTRSVEITEAGTAFLEQARAGLSLVDAAVSRAQAVGRGEAGALTIGLVGGADTPPIPRLLRDFRRRRPGVAIAVQELTTSEQVDRLLDGRLDVGFLRPPLATPAARRLDLLTVARDRLVAALPRSHPAAGRASLSLRSLAGEPFVRTPRERGAGFHDQITALCRQAGFEPETAQEAVQISSVIGLVAAGFGVSVVPDPHRAHAGVAFVPLTARAAHVDLALAVPRDRPRSPQASAFVALAATLARR